MIRNNIFENNVLKNNVFRATVGAVVKKIVHHLHLLTSDGEHIKTSDGFLLKCKE